MFTQLDPDEPNVVLTKEQTGVDPVHPLVKSCDSTEELRFERGKLTYEFAFCSHNVSVFYKANVAAFIDANDNGQLDVGEPYGVYHDNPLNREKEDSLREKGLSITIDRLYSPQVR